MSPSTSWSRNTDRYLPGYVFQSSRSEGRKGWEGKAVRQDACSLPATHYLSTVGPCRFQLFRQNPSRHHPSVLSIEALSLSVRSLLFEPRAGRLSGSDLARTYRYPGPMLRSLPTHLAQIAALARIQLTIQPGLVPKICLQPR